MRQLRAFMLRLRGLFRSHRADDDFAVEVESHVALHTEDGIRAGLTPTEARRLALIRLGGAEQTRQAHRNRRTLPWLESLLRDIVYGLRTLAKHRGATAIAILSIGLGIGANATIFSMVSRFILRPAPVGDPTTLLAVHTLPQGEQCCNAFSYPLYTDLRDQAKSFSGVAAYYELIPASIGGSAEPERVWGQGVTANFFSVAEIPMKLGRGFVSGEDNAPAVVLGAGLWQRHFNADPAIIGKTVTLSNHIFTVVGVAPPAFHGIEQILYTEFWVPLGNVANLVPLAPKESAREYHWAMVIARLKPGVARSQVAAVIRRFDLAQSLRRAAMIGAAGKEDQHRQRAAVMGRRPDIEIKTIFAAFGSDIVVPAHRGLRAWRAERNRVARALPRMDRHGLMPAKRANRWRREGHAHEAHHIALGFAAQLPVCGSNKRRSGCG